MKHARIQFVAALGLLTTIATPVLNAGDSFEGTIHYTLTSETQPMDMVHFIKGSRMRIEVPLDGVNTAVSIVNLADREISILMPGQNMYMIMPLPAGVGMSDTNVPELIDTGETGEILGYDCTRYLLKDKERQVEIWATQELGPYVSASNPMQKNGSKNAWETMLADSGLFPLRVAEMGKNGGETFSLDVTRIDPGQLDEALFTVPEGYQEFTMPSMPGMPFGN
jgi:hypothetical protein